MLSHPTTFMVCCLNRQQFETVSQMTEDFQFDNAASFPPTDSPSSDDLPNREAVRLIVVSSRRGVTNMIHTLHLRGVARANEWSALQPEPMTGQWMSIVTKYIQF
jgi:hypothetical protein